MKKNTICVHSGSSPDQQFKGIVTPVHTSTSFAYLDMEKKRYPRYFNTPNQETIVKKLCALENAHDGILFSSGMAAISSVILTFLKKGDHAVFQRSLYGGTSNLIQQELEKYGISFDFASGNDVKDFEKRLRPETRLVYIETPSNPLMEIVDIRKISELARQHGITSVIDNTFASPINQNPSELGIDIIIHSATKYLGGHSDLIAGIAVGKKKMIDEVKNMGISLGGSINATTCATLERSLKTLGLRVKKQNDNAEVLASFLNDHPKIQTVNYPGLQDHPGYETARSQMTGFGGMLSFELKETIDPLVFQKNLKLVRPSMSLGGVESTICSSTLTSHGNLTADEKEKLGISDHLLRLSVGIEDIDDLIEDLHQCFTSSG